MNANNTKTKRNETKKIKIKNFTVVAGTGPSSAHVESTPLFARESALPLQRRSYYGYIHHPQPCMDNHAPLYLYYTLVYYTTTPTMPLYICTKPSHPTPLSATPLHTFSMCDRCVMVVWTNNKPGGAKGQLDWLRFPRNILFNNSTTHKISQIRPAILSIHTLSLMDSLPAGNECPPLLKPRTKLIVDLM
jgi:hypothetical protein